MFFSMQDIEFEILDFIQNNMRSPLMDRIMVFFTWIGEYGIIWLLAGVVLLFIRKYRADGITLLAAIGVGALVANVTLKNLVMHARPCWIRSEIPLLIAVPKDYSFPSGHTMASIIACVVIVHAKPKLAWGVIPLALIISFSRLYLYVHFPTDVLFSMIVGSIIGLSACLVEKKVQRKIAAKNTPDATR